MMLLAAKGTSLVGQEWTGPSRIFGLWNEVHPMELRLAPDGRGAVWLSGDSLPLQLHGQRGTSGWTFSEVLPDGSVSGTWTLADADQGKRASWANYNQSLGARSLLDSRPLPEPDLQIKLFQFRTTEGEWYLFIYPAPPARWRGIAWSTTHPKPLQVTGSREDQQFFLEVVDPENDEVFRLSFPATRTYPRFGWWSGRQPIPEKIRFRHRKAVPLKTRREASFTGELLVLEPDLDWPGWQSFARQHLEPVLRQFRQEQAEILRASRELRPFQRHAVRCYAWVTWSFLRDDLLSGTLHVATTWGPPVKHPFLVAKGYSRPLTLADIWSPQPLPRDISAMLPNGPESDPARHPVLELRPDGLYLWQDQPAHIPTARLKGNLPRNSPLYPFFGR
jgi:hypothetical protein